MRERTLRPISFLGTLIFVGLLLILSTEENVVQADPPKAKVLITGFGPFQNVRVNPSWAGAKQLSGEVIEDHEVVAVELPVDYRKIRDELPLLIKKHDPQVVIHFGVYWPGALRFEQRARNSISRIPDVSGYYPEDRRVTEDGPMIYRSRLPESDLLKEMPEAGFDMVSSDDAGRYVCEFTFYTELYNLDKLSKDADAGFIHVAPLGQPLNTKELGKAMTEIVRICLKKRAEKKAADQRNREESDSAPVIGQPAAEPEGSQPTSRSTDSSNSNDRRSNPVGTRGMTDALGRSRE
jgi:pyroglutamyl-peptidase